MQVFHLTLFFTYGMSLQVWDRIGSLSRELAIYKAMQAQGVKLSFITYGKQDLQYQAQFPNINICTKRFMPVTRVYSALIPILHGSILAQTDIIKTNQMLGAKEALRAAKLYHKPLIVRQGYMWSANVCSDYGEDWEHPTVRYIMQYEDTVWRQANHIIVTTQEMRDSIMTRLPELDSKVAIVPNYVNTDIFRPLDIPKQHDLVFVGRLSPEKNVLQLLDVLEQLPDVSLLLIGSGIQEAQVKERLSEISNHIKYIPRVSNEELPAIFNQAKALIMISQYEGLPKVLLEAMACGLPVIGTNVRGINNVLQHDNNGFLCETDTRSIREAIQTVLSNQPLQYRLGEQARQTILDHYALKHIVEKELAIMERLHHS